MSKTPERLHRKPYYLTQREISLLLEAIDFTLAHAKSVSDDKSYAGSFQSRFCGKIVCKEYAALKEVLS